MNLKCKYFSNESSEFQWDKKALETFKIKIKEKDIKCRMDDIFLLGFLRARKYDQNRSLELLVNYYNRRIEYPQYFNDLLPSKVENAFSLKVMQFMPKPTQDGRYFCIYKLANWDTSVSNVTDLLKSFLLCYDFLLNFHRTQENSIVVIVDAAGLSLSHLLQCTPRVINSILTIIFRNSYQLRIREMHYVNMNVIVKALLDFMIPLLPLKMKERLFLHSEMSSLHKFIHPQYLPAEYDGELPNFDSTEFIEMIKENEEFFRMNEDFAKKYEEYKNQKFSEGTFRYIDEDKRDEKLKQLLEDTEEKFKCLEKNPESYLSNIESNVNFEVTHF